MSGASFFRIAHRGDAGSGQIRGIHGYAGLRIAVGLHEDDLDGVFLRDILKGAGRHGAHALAVHQYLGHGIARIRGNGKGLVTAFPDSDPAGGGDRAVSAYRDPDGAAGVVVTAV